MNKDFRILIAIMLSLPILVLLSADSFSATYSVIDLGTMDGKFEKVSPAAINNRGEVVGVGFWEGSDGFSHANGFIWDEVNGMRDIGSFGGRATNPYDINDLGQVVGYSDYPDDRWRHAFFWENTKKKLMVLPLGKNLLM